MLLAAAIALALFVLPSGWGIALVAAAAVVEVAETWFWIRLSRRRRVQVGAETLIGAQAETVTPNQVRVQGELWQARSEAPLVPGQRVRVVGREGLILEVERLTP